MKTLTSMLREDMYMEPEKDRDVLADALAVEKNLSCIKIIFKEWLREVGLPNYISLDRDRNEFSSSQSIRQLLINLVDEP